MKKIQLLGFLFLALFASSVIAASSPIAFLDVTANQVISSLQAQKATIKSNPRAVYSIVNRYLVPKIDTYGMARSVLGRDAWNKATEAQKHRFSHAFTTLVVRTYAGALAQYTNEKVKFNPIRGSYSDRVQVDSIVVRSNGPNIPISYRLIQSGSSWKIYDMSVEGVSLLQSFRSQFAAELRRGNLDNLIQIIEKKNS